MIILTLKKVGNIWLLFAPKGHIVYEMAPSITNKEQALEQARSWASSWNYMRVRTEDEQ